MGKLDQGMIPARPGLDLEAKSVGKADQNATTQGTDRAPDGDHLPKTEGPRRGDRREYLPAEYSKTRELLASDGTIKEFTTIRRDR